MTIKAYRTTRYQSDRLPKQTKRPEARRAGSFWGVSWQLDDLDESNWDAMPSNHASGTRRAR